MNVKSDLKDVHETDLEREDEDLRLAEVLEEYLAELERGVAPDRQTLLARHPDLAEQLTRCLDGLEVARRIGIQLRDDSTGSASQAPANIPKRFGDFQILREVGCGGMGVVYEAEQQSIRRRVALKILPLAAVMDPRHVQRFQHEVQAAALLDHTNIVSVYSVGVERGVHYYAMQYIDGHTLQELIGQLRAVAGKNEATSGIDHDPRGRLKTINTTLTADVCPTPPVDSPDNDPPLTEPDVDTESLAMLSTAKLSGRGAERCRGICKLIIQAAEALDHAHSRGVLHRDVKPGNLMVDGTGMLWITDFGLARLEADVGITMTGDIVGTLRYMSPEQALAKRAVIDHRTDIYSLGATFYEALTLQPPFQANDRQVLLEQLAFEQPRRPRKIDPAIPRELETIVLKAIEKNPADRYDTAQQMADDLERFLQDRPILASPPSLVDRLIKARAGK